MSEKIANPYAAGRVLIWRGAGGIPAGRECRRAPHVPSHHARLAIETPRRGQYRRCRHVRDHQADYADAPAGGVDKAAALRNRHRDLRWTRHSQRDFTAAIRRPIGIAGSRAIRERRLRVDARRAVEGDAPACRWSMAGAGNRPSETIHSRRVPPQYEDDRLSRRARSFFQRASHDAQLEHDRCDREDPCYQNTFCKPIAFFRLIVQ